MLILITIGCAERASISAPDPPNFDLPEDRYPTEEEFAAEGGSPSLTVTKPVGRFFGPYTQPTSFFAASDVAFTWVNVASATLTASLVDQADGTPLNSATDRHESSLYRPVRSGGKSLSAEAGTLNRKCGLTGKSKVVARAELHLLRVEVGGFKPFMMWSDEREQAGADVSLPPCEKEEEEPVEEGEEGGEDSPPGGGGGSDGGDDGDDRWCTQWRITGYESRDGGQTWRETYQYYVWICD